MFKFIQLDAVKARSIVSKSLTTDAILLAHEVRYGLSFVSKTP